MESIINKLYSLLSRGTSRKYLRALALLAFSWSLYKSWRIINFLEGNLIRKPRNLRVRYGEGTFAVVADPLTPVGRSFCVELARRSFNLILVGSDKEKLESLAEECNVINQKLEVKILIFDIQKANDETYYDLLFSHIKHLNISILVANNVSHNQDSFLSMQSQDISNILLKDCYATLFLFRKVIPSMLGRNAPSGVILISGYRQWTRKVLSPAISGASAFRQFLAASLGIEYSDKLDVLVVKPFEVEGEIVFEEKLPEPAAPVVHILRKHDSKNMPNGLSESGVGRLTKKQSRHHQSEETEALRIVEKKSEITQVDKNEEKVMPKIMDYQHVPFWRRVSANAFVVACLEKLSFEKETYGHWKHEFVSLFLNK